MLYEPQESYAYWYANYNFDVPFHRWYSVVMGRALRALDAVSDESPVKWCYTCGGFMMVLKGGYCENCAELIVGN